VSVEGTASELLAATNHPAVRAVAPWFSDYNYYTDLLRPGGIYNEWILKNFEDFRLQMDSGDSAKHVDGDPEGVLMKQAITEHRGNLDIYSATKDASFIDDPLATTGKSLLDISIPGIAAALRKSQVPMLIFASWYDAGTVQGTIQRYREFSNSQRVFVGAWSHGAGYNSDPFLPSRAVQPSQQQQWLEALQFFRRYLKDVPNQAGTDRLFFYYTIGKNEWQSTNVWPPKSLRKITYQLNSNGKLDLRDSGGSLRVKLQTTSTGERNRWHTQFGGGPVDYSAALKQMSELTSFVTAPLEAPMEITGQAVLRLRLSCSENDPSVIAYLVAVDAKGNSFYLTEGHLRLLHRKLDASEQTLHTYTRRDAEPVPKDQEFEADLTLLPISVSLQKGTRLQLLLASGDNATFASSREYEVTIFSSSQLELPVK
jgi:putative CocE/NonD family hydrolase